MAIGAGRRKVLEVHVGERGGGAAPMSRTCVRLTSNEAAAEQEEGCAQHEGGLDNLVARSK